MTLKTNFIIEKPDNILEALDEKVPKTPMSNNQNTQQVFNNQSSNENSRHERMKSRTSMDMNTTTTGAGSASLTLLKQHIQIVSLNEEIQELKLAYKDLESELSNKNQEVYEVIKRLLFLFLSVCYSYLESLCNMINKYKNSHQRISPQLKIFRSNSRNYVPRTKLMHFK